MNVRELKDNLINGYTEYLSNQNYEVTVSLNDKTPDDAEYIYLTVFQLNKNEFSLCFTLDGNAIIKGKAKTIRRHKIATNILADTPMFEIIQDSLIGSDDLDINPEVDMSYKLDIDTEPETLTIF